MVVRNAALSPRGVSVGKREASYHNRTEFSGLIRKTEHVGIPRFQANICRKAVSRSVSLAVGLVFTMTA